MGTYDPLLSGALNLYNVSLAALALVGLLVLGVLIARASHERMPFPVGLRRVVVAVALVLLAIGALVFVAFTFAESVHDIPSWGVFFLLPATFLLGVSVLALLRATQAGYVLAVAALVTLLTEIALGVIADQIDAGWARDEMDKGNVAFAGLLFCLPAGLTAWLLLIAGPPCGAQLGNRSRGILGSGTAIRAAGRLVLLPMLVLEQAPDSRRWMAMARVVYSMSVSLDGFMVRGPRPRPGLGRRGRGAAPVLQRRGPRASGVPLRSATVRAHGRLLADG